MVIKKIILVGILVSSFSKIHAQGKERSWFGLETDPISTTFGARTLSAVVEPAKMGHFSLFFNVVNADFPNWMDDFLNPKNKGKGLESKIKIGGGFGGDYFVKEEKEGLYFGLLNLIFEYQVRQSTGPSDESNTFLTGNLIPRIGYRWYPSKKVNFYINPFLGMRYEYAMQNPLIYDTTEYLPAGVQPFGTVHLGYHF